ncbi:MAG: biotin--[acetyl-CoA-carboxylase] ligase [Bacteroidetes bacterium]|jgi:BirA family biotin operon repressor/biotin-[acetyl-CoA-carboxylase] ligase|nr:biotin--[acetyl-CoA-carboxylase] ligase [Bacteroidota bacterium]
MKIQKYSKFNSHSNATRSSGLVRCHFSRLKSTQDTLSKWVSKTPPSEFSVVSADVQTGGRGQYGRAWQDGGGNLALSIIVYPKGLAADQQFLLQMWSAISIYDTLQSLGLATDELFIKWPNDILIKDDKIAGILLQSIVSGSYIRHAIIGIGLNVRATPRGLPHVTSLYRQGIIVSPGELREQILGNLYQSYQDIKFNRGVSAYRDIYHQRMWRYQKEVTFMAGDKKSEGRILGITSSGHLVLKCEGETKVVMGPEVRFDR